MIEHVLEGCQCEGKRCMKCEKVKCREAFNRRSRSCDGKCSYCKECESSHKKKFYRENTEKIKSYKKVHYLKNAEKIKAQKSLYQKSHRSQMNQRKRAYRLVHPEKHRLATSKWIKAHPEQAKMRNRRHYVNHMEWHRARKLAYQKANPEKMKASSARRRTLQTQAGGFYTVQEWEALKAHYNYACLRCGRTDVQLTADHVIPVNQGGSSYISNIQPLCFPCNAWKRTKIIDYRKGNQ